MRPSRRTTCLSPVGAELASARLTSRSSAKNKSKRRTPSRNPSLIPAFSIDYRPFRNSLKPPDIREQLSHFVSINSELLMHAFPANPLLSSFYKLGTRGIRHSARLTSRRAETRKSHIRTSTFESNHLRTLLHFSAGSLLLSICSPKHTRGIPPCASDAPQQIKSRKIIEFPSNACACTCLPTPPMKLAESELPAHPEACYLRTLNDRCLQSPRTSLAGPDIYLDPLLDLYPSTASHKLFRIDAR
jgi:hypothetical protein